MREIKFRAWDKDLEEWIPEESIIINKGKPIAIMNQTDLPIQEALNKKGKLINPNWELMQFTGLKDKNDKEIYEGDIIEFKKDGCTQEQGCGEICKDFVIFSDGKFSINGWSWHEAKWYIVIGNIYENPELME